ncbi:MAG: NAD(P)H-dependent glycerol-3-phosphate dehydrogenase [bacterium]
MAKKKLDAKFALKRQVTVLGAGNMGTSIAQIIAKNGHSVVLWNYYKDLKPLEQINKYGENKKYLKGVKLSKNIKCEPNIGKAVAKAKIVFYAVPSFCIADVMKASSKHLLKNTVCVDVSKGIDEKSLGIVPDVIKSNLPVAMRKLVATISGPAIARDMVVGGFTAMNVASKSQTSIKIIKEVMENNNLKLFPTNDVIGIEVTGSFKNVYAIAMGVCDGLKMPMNTKAALLTIALREISELVKKMGGSAKTVYDLAGLGDLIGTGLCVRSRNRMFGEYLAKGFKVESAKKKVNQVVEGISAAKTLTQLAEKYNINLPFAKMVHNIASGKSNPKKAIQEYLAGLLT